MYFLKETSKVIERFRIAYPQYWLDKLMSEIHEACKGTGGAIMTGQVLGILRHPQLERGVVIPGVGILNRPLDELRKLAFVAGLNGRLAKEVLLGVNLVTNDGDIYYAQMGTNEAVTDDFTAGGIRLGSANTAVTKSDTDVTTFLAGTGHAEDATYPQTDDGDADNTGAGVDIMTWTFSYLTSEGNQNGIQEGAIVDNTTTPTAALTHFLFAASFNKTSSDTLKCIINHEVLGV